MLRQAQNAHETITDIKVQHNEVISELYKRAQLLKEVFRAVRLAELDKVDDPDYVNMVKTYHNSSCFVDYPENYKSCDGLTRVIEYIGRHEEYLLKRGIVI